MRLEDERIALSMAELRKHAGKGDRPLSPSEFRRIVRCTIRACSQAWGHVAKWGRSKLIGLWYDIRWPKAPSPSLLRYVQ